MGSMKLLASAQKGSLNVDVQEALHESLLSQVLLAEEVYMPFRSLVA